MTWSFDIRSALVVGALLTMLVGALMLLASRTLPSSYRRSMLWWVAATMMLPGSSIALVLRDGGPSWVGVLVSNTLVGAAFAAVAIALEIFQGRPRRRVHLWLLVGAMAVATVGMRDFVPDRAVRLSVVAALLAGLLASALWNLYKSPRSAGITRHALGVMLGLAAGILIYRAVVMYFVPAQVTAMFALTHVQVLTYAVGSVLPVAASVAFLMMCTERSQRELQRAARIDFLTDCYNRRAIEELGMRAIAAARRHGMPLALVAIDIDHFKRINDELGHAAGDDALTAVVSRIRTTLRNEDLLGRMGGEEFVVLMPNTDSGAAMSAAERIRAAFSATPLELDGHRRRVTLSVGVAVLAPADREFAQLLSRADRAMYAAKNAGRDLVIADAMSGWEGGGGSPP